MKRLFVLFAMPIMALSVACGTGSPESPAAQSSSSPDREAERLKFNKCLREQGVDVPDEPSTGFEIPEKAFQACRQHLGSGKTIDFRDPAVKDAYTRFARCMRKNGIDFPDPGPNGELPPPDYDGGDKVKFKKGLEACNQHLPDVRGK